MKVEEGQFTSMISPSCKSSVRRVVYIPSISITLSYKDEHINFDDYRRSEDADEDTTGNFYLYPEIKEYIFDRIKLCLSMHENLISVYPKDFVITYNTISKRLENKIILLYANGQGGNYFLDKIFSPQDLIEFSKRFEIIS